MASLLDSASARKRKYVKGGKTCEKSPATAPHVKVIRVDHDDRDSLVEVEVQSTKSGQSEGLALNSVSSERGWTSLGMVVDLAWISASSGGQDSA